MVGALNIFNALLAQNNSDIGMMKAATRFLAKGKVPVMMFGYPLQVMLCIK